MSTLRHAAAEAVARVISAAVGDDASGNCRAGEDDEEEVASYPAIRVLTRRVEFMPWQEEGIELEDNPSLTDHSLARVGDFEGRLEIRVYHTYPTRREALEEQIMYLLTSQEGAPGTLVAQTDPVIINGISTLYPATVSCFLDNAEWTEEFVFEKKRMSFLELDFSYEALALRNAFTIDQIRLELEAPPGSPPELVDIDENESITPTP